MLFRTGERDNKTIWCYTKEPICDVCKQEIIDFSAGFIVQWIKKEGRKDSLIHDTCMKRFVKHPLCVIQYRWSVLITDTPPPKAVPLFIQEPSLTNSKNDLSVYDFDKLPSDRTKDNAWRSKKYPSIEGATIGASLPEPDEIEDIEQYLLTMKGDA